MNETVEYTHTINVPLMRKMLEHITAHPEEHDQDYWGHIVDEVTDSNDAARCGTVACAAGWTCLLSGNTVWGEQTDGTRELLAVDDAGEVVSVMGRAQELLGLNLGQAHAMFLMAGRAQTVWELAHCYTQGEIEIPADMS